MVISLEKAMLFMKRPTPQTRNQEACQGRPRVHTSICASHKKLAEFQKANWSKPLRRAYSQTSNRRAPICSGGREGCNAGNDQSTAKTALMVRAVGIEPTTSSTFSSS